MNYLAPIALFVYCRPGHTQRMLESLMQNELASNSELFIFADGPKESASSLEILNIKQTRKVIRQKKWCKKVSIVESEKNKGLANSIIDGVTDVVNKYGKIIVLEDDLVISPYFLQFMNDALNTYASNEETACISAYIYPVKGNLPETFFIKGADCWGWATWKRAWELFEIDGKKLLNEIETQGLTVAFNFENSYNYTQMLQDQITGKNDSWAIRWYASAFLKNKYCLYPGTSLVQNIGIDGSGTHSGSSDKWDVQLSSQKIKVHIIPTKESIIAKKAIIHYFKNLHKKPSFLKNFFNKLKGKN